MKTYTLRVRFKKPSTTEQFKFEEDSQDFECHVENGQIKFPPDALRIIMGRHPEFRRIQGGAEWIGEAPEVYACGAQTDEDAQEISKSVNDQADLAMQIMADQVEAEKPPTMEQILRLYGPPAPVKIVGPAEV